MEPKYDAFISYSHADREWVENWLLNRLEGAKISVCIDFRDFDIGVPSLDNMDEAVARSDKTIIVLTPNWVKSEWTAFESLLAQTSDPAGVRRRILPVMLIQCEPPRRLGILTWADFRDSKRWDTEIKRVINAIKKTEDKGPTTPERPPATDDSKPWTRDDGSAKGNSSTVKTYNQSGGINIGGGQSNIGDVVGGNKYERHGDTYFNQGESSSPARQNNVPPPSRPQETRSATAATGSTLRVMVSHAAGDEATAKDLYRRLRSDGYEVWLDTESILPGQQFEREVTRAVRASDIVLVCLSQKAINRAGAVHKQIKYALDIADEQPDGAIFVIPVKLEPCELPDRLGHLAPVNLYEPNGYARLLRALQIRIGKG